MTRQRSGSGRTLAAVITATAALALGAGTAGAQNLDINELAAAVALPVLTGGHPPNTLKFSQGGVVLGAASSINLLTITNARSVPTVLKIEVISGDPNGPAGGDQWQSDSFNCLLTGRETVTFLVTPNPGPSPGSIIYGECTNSNGVGNNNVFFAAKAANGIFWAAAADPLPGTVPPFVVSQDILLADAVVIDTATGKAFSFGAIPFQAGTGANNGDMIYKFDGLEYRKWPATVATNFIASSDVGSNTNIRGELVLFTLDGSTTALAPPRVSMAGLCFNDDEVSFDFSHTFDCFDVIAISDMSANCSQPFLGSLSGHLILMPQQVGTGGNDSHDATFGDGNNFRRRPVHGWIVQDIVGPGVAVLAGQPTALPAPPGQPNQIAVQAPPVAWARPLSQGRTDLMPFLADKDPTLDAE